MQRKPSDTVADLNKIVEEEGQVGGKLKEKISACQNFLVNTEMENERHKVLTSKFPSWMRKLSMRNLKKSSSPILPLKSTLLWALNKNKETYKEFLCLFRAGHIHEWTQ